MRKLKLIDDNDLFDSLFILFYVSILGSVYDPRILIVSFLSSILIIVRDEILRKNKTKDQEFIEKIEEIENELSTIKISQGIKVLK